MRTPARAQYERWVKELRESIRLDKKNKYRSRETRPELAKLANLRDMKDKDLRDQLVGADRTWVSAVHPSKEKESEQLKEEFDEAVYIKLSAGKAWLDEDKANFANRIYRLVSREIPEEEQRNQVVAVVDARIEEVQAAWAVPAYRSFDRIERFRSLEQFQEFWLSIKSDTRYVRVINYTKRRLLSLP